MGDYIFFSTFVGRPPLYLPLKGGEAFVESIDIL